MLTYRDIRIMEKLSKKAIQSKKKNHERTVVAGIAYKNRIYKIGHNDYGKTHPATPQLKPQVVITKHAEIDCIDKFFKVNYGLARKRIHDCTIYIVSLTGGESVNYSISSMPCESCFQAIYEIGIPRIVYHSSLNYGWGWNNFELYEQLLKK